MRTTKVFVLCILYQIIILPRYKIDVMFAPNHCDDHNSIFLLFQLLARHCLSMAGFFDRSSGCSIDVNYGDGDDHGRNDEKLITSFWWSLGFNFFTTSIGGIYHSLTSDMKLGHDWKIVLSYSLSPTCHSKIVSSYIAWFVPLVFLFCIWAFKICERVILRGIEWWHLTG